MPGETSKRHRNVGVSKSQTVLEMRGMDVSSRQLLSDFQSLSIFLQGTLLLSRLKEHITHQRVAPGQIVLPLIICKIFVGQLLGNLHALMERFQGLRIPLLGQE